MKGKIICFEGIDGAGKRTQAALLAKALRRLGKRTAVYSYPDYSSAYGRIIRKYLRGKLKLGRPEHFLLFLMDIMKDEKSIKAEIDRGTVVIMDRYFYTALAYICPSGLDYANAKKFVGTTGLIAPAVVLYLDIPTELTIKRKAMQHKSLDKFERSQKFLKEVKKVYRTMMDEHYGCKRWIRIDASKSISAVHEDILNSINSGRPSNPSPGFRRT